MRCDGWESMTLMVAGITHSSSVDGRGFRDVVFVSYCPHRCPGCHNPETWEWEGGKSMTLREVYDDLMKSRITNVTYSGGEPFEQAEELRVLTDRIRESSRKNFWVYSGYTFEQLIEDPAKRALLERCDVLVDGRFDREKTELNLRFKGSTNQRIIDIKKSLDMQQVVLYEDT